MLGLLFYQLENELKNQSIQRLRYQAKNISMAIYERLLLVEDEMRMFLSLASSPLQYEAKPSRLGNSRFQPKYLKNLFRLGPQAAVPLFVRGPHYCGIRFSELSALESDKPLIINRRCSAGYPHLSMAIRISDSEWLIAQIDEGYLWNESSNFNLEAAIEFCVVDDRKEVIVASVAKPAILVDALKRLTTRESLANFSWGDGKQDYVASAHSLFLKSRFLASHWDIILTQSQGSILSPIRLAETIFLLVGLLMILIVFLLSRVTIRRSLNPLNQLIASTKAIGDEDFANRTVIKGSPEVQELLDAFNLMSTKIEKRVAERTLELKSINQELSQEINQRIGAEEAAKQAKEYAESANRAKSDFLANMSHELRTPLNHILGFTELVVDKQCGDLNEVQEEYLNDALQSSRHLLSLINDILDLSKVEAGKLKLEVTEIHLRNLLEGSLGIVKEKAIKHRLQLSTDIDGTQEVIQADERKLKQILYNLLSNAVKFTPDGGSVTISARDLSFRDGQWFTRDGQPVGLPLNEDDPRMKGKELIHISVRDTGTGIRGEDLQRIFDPFEQAKNSAGRKEQGTGLGLSLTKRLVELHGGEIWAESEGEGRGSKFSFTIPLSPLPMVPKDPKHSETSQS
jgi:signal transduction histidine kinase